MIARRPVCAFLFLTLSVGLMPASFVSLSREAGATGRSSRRSTASRPSTVLVGFRDGVSQVEKGRIEHAVGASERGVIGAGTHVLHFAEGSVGVAIDKLKSYPQVRYAEPDYIVHADLTPNDRYYRQLWGMGAIHASQAWDLTTGSGGVVVGVVDTGIDYTHPDLAANVWTNTTGLNACPPGTHGYNVINGTCDPMDDNEHGTHVSGTIGAVGNNDIGVVGVSSNVSIMGLKFLNSYGSGTTSGAIAAIDGR
jgi:subtilisin family serine protease